MTLPEPEEEDVNHCGELRNLLVTLVFAAHDTTRHQLANAMLAFARHPEQWTLLGARPELTGQAVEEVVRWYPSAPTIYRFAREDFEHEGLRIAKGTLVLMCTAAAQRDPRVFQDGARFDITVNRDTPPLQFGGGPHHCLGSALARAEVGEALPVLAQRWGPPVVTGTFTTRPPIGIHGPDSVRCASATEPPEHPGKALATIWQALRATLRPRSPRIAGKGIT